MNDNAVTDNDAGLPSLTDTQLLTRWLAVEWPSEEADLLAGEMERRNLND